MAIKYYLQPNPITPDPNDQSARVQATGVLSIADIIKRMLKRGTTITETDATAVILLFMQEMIDAVTEGYSVNTDLVNIRPSIQGVFTNVNDSFDASRHTIRASVTAGNILFTKMLAASVEKVKTSVISPSIVEFIDNRTNTNTQATKGSIGTIIGSELKYDAQNPLEGIFFINNATSTETKVTDIATRTEGKLLFVIPASLVAGTYKLEVRKAYTAVKAIRSDVFTNLLTVV